MFNGICAAQNKQSSFSSVKGGNNRGNPLSHAILRGAWMNTGKIFLTTTMTIWWIPLISMKRWAWKIPLSSSIPIMIIQTSSTDQVIRQTLINRDWNEDQKTCSWIDLGPIRRWTLKMSQVLVSPLQIHCLGWDNTEALVREIYQTLGE